MKLSVESAKNGRNLTIGMDIGMEGRTFLTPVKVSIAQTMLFSYNSMKDYKKLAKETRREVLKIICTGKTSHAASNLSAVDFTVVLYENLKPKDRVVWSAGWKAALIYLMLEKQGKITKEQLKTFPNPPFLGLAEVGVPGVLVSGGSVGHGLGVSVGIALAKKRAGEKGTVYVIMSDGELNEGSTWEAVMLASHHKLDNLVAIIDKNGWQAMGKCEDVIYIDEVKAFQGFGWHAHGIDGHNHKQLEVAFTTENPTGKPLVFVCNTVKGKGVSFMENHLLYHYKHVSDEDLEKALVELQ